MCYFQSPFQELTVVSIWNEDENVINEDQIFEAEKSFIIVFKIYLVLFYIRMNRWDRYNLSWKHEGKKKRNI